MKAVLLTLCAAEKIFISPYNGSNIYNNNNTTEKLN